MGNYNANNFSFNFGKEVGFEISKNFGLVKKLRIDRGVTV